MSTHNSLNTNSLALNTYTGSNILSGHASQGVYTRVEETFSTPMRIGSLHSQSSRGNKAGAWAHGTQASVGLRGLGYDGFREQELYNEVRDLRKENTVLRQDSQGLRDDNQVLRKENQGLREDNHRLRAQLDNKVKELEQAKLSAPIQ